jgi:hypothetical protein
LAEAVETPAVHGASDTDGAGVLPAGGERNNIRQRRPVSVHDAHRRRLKSTRQESADPITELPQLVRAPTTHGARDPECTGEAVPSGDRRDICEVNHYALGRVSDVGRAGAARAIADLALLVGSNAVR